MLRLYITVFISGAALMGLEIAGSRVLAPVYGNSVFTWGALITVFLASLSLGYALGGRIADRWPRPALLAHVLTAAGVSVWVLLYRPGVLMSAPAHMAVPERFRVLIASFLLFALPSVLMGFVTPFATKLAVKELQSVGKTAGWLASVSTAGSIAGTFSMTFLLIPVLPIEPLLFGSGAVLVLTGGLLVPGAASFIRAAMSMVLCTAASLLFLLLPEETPVPIPNGKIILEKETAYHRLLVVEQGTRRALYFDNSCQGWVIMKEGEFEPPNYRDALLLGLGFRKTPAKSATMIGLGTGMVPRFLSRKLPQVATASIEIDPEVVRVATAYFDFHPDVNDRVITGDGRFELSRQVMETDIIFQDAFFSDSIPFHLTTREFLELCHSRLSPDGVYAANIVGLFTGKDNQFFWAFYKTVRSVFPSVYIFCPELSLGRKTFLANAVIIATKSPDRLSREEILERTADLASELSHPQLQPWAKSLFTGEIPSAGVPLLTDSYSPTDALQHFGRR